MLYYGAVAKSKWSASNLKNISHILHLPVRYGVSVVNILQKSNCDIKRLENSSTHWGRVMHICVGKLTIIGSDNGLSPGRRQAIIWTSAGVVLIGPLGTNFSEILTGIQTFSFKKMHLKMASGKWRPFCLDLNVSTVCWPLRPLATWGKHTFCIDFWMEIGKHRVILSIGPEGSLDLGAGSSLERL